MIWVLIIFYAVALLYCYFPCLKTKGSKNFVTIKETEGGTKMANMIVKMLNSADRFLSMIANWFYE